MIELAPKQTERRTNAGAAFQGDGGLVYSRMVSQLYQVDPAVLASSCVGIGIAGALASWRANDIWLAVLLGISISLILLEFPLARLFKKAREPRDMLAWERRFGCLALLQTLATSLATARGILFSSDATVHLIVIALSLSGIPAVLRNYGSKPIFLGQLGLLILVPAFAMIATLDPIYMALALGAFALVHSVASIGLAHHRGALALYKQEWLLTLQTSRLMDALENTHHGLSMFDSEGRLVLCNSRYTEIFKLSPAVVRPGVSVREIVQHSAEVGNHPQDQVDELAHTILRQFASAAVGFLHRLSDGRTIRVHHEPMALGGWVATFEDVTEQLLGEAALKESEEKLRAIVETTPECIKIVAADGQLLHMNRAGLQMMECSSLEDIAGVDVSSIIVREHRREWKRNHQKVVKGQPTSWSFDLLTPSGTRLTVETSAVPLSLSDGSTAQLAITRDVTKERRLQEELMRSSRVTAMGAMGAALAHELNQPLAAISNSVGAAAILVRQQNGEAVTPLARALEIAKEEALRAGSIIERIRGFVSRGEIAKESVSLTAVIDDALSMFSFLPLSAPRLSNRVDHGAEWALGDRVQLRQVFFNLFRNAVEASPHRQVAISVTSEITTGGQLRVNVSDDGPGLSEEQISTVLQPFSSTKSNGMGVGLAICDAIIRAHGGKLVAGNGVGSGAEFSFTLVPAATQDTAFAAA